MAVNAGDFNVFYADNPISALDRNQWRDNDPQLRTMFRAQNIYTPFAAHKIDMGARNAKQMTVTDIYDIHPGFDQIGLRQLWMPSAHVDTRQVTITFGRYGGKVGYHEYDDLITRWELGGANKARFWAAVLREKLGQHIVAVHDFLARNAYITGGIDSGYALFGSSGAASAKFADISTSDKITTPLLDEITLGMKSRGIAYGENPAGGVGAIMCLTSPSVIYDLMHETGSNFGEAFLPTMQYADPGAALRNEIGMYNGVRFVETPRAILFNCGAVYKQCIVNSPIQAGAGAAALVDGTYTPGQSGATAYVQLSDFDASDFAVNDTVTLHVQRTSDHGVTNGVDYRDGKLQNFRIIEVNATDNQIKLDRPVMTDFTLDLTGAGVYGYVTKGRHIHTSIFIGAPGGVVAGIGIPITLKNPPPVDDFESMWRFSWNSYMGYNLFTPGVFEVIFTAGTYRTKGRAAVQ